MFEHFKRRGEDGTGKDVNLFEVERKKGGGKQH